MKHKIKEENKILIMLAFYSISIGLWGNFGQLWLEQNQFNVSQISKVLSFATLLCAVAILFVGKKIKGNRIKRVVFFSLILKIVNAFVLVLLNNKLEYQNSIRILFIVDIIIEKLITITIYPFICTIKKDDTLYSKRKLVEYLFKDIGILIGGVVIGRTLYGHIIDYNSCLFISIVFLVIATIVLGSIQQQQVKSETKINEKLDIIQYIKKHKILKIYLCYRASGNIAMGVGLGLKMLMLTNIFEFSANVATTYLLVVGLVADVIGILALKYFTPKDDYLTIFIKFGIRFLGYILAFISHNLFVCLLAITWSLLIATAYENKIDGQFINAVEDDYQLLFNNVAYIVEVIASAIGLFFAGILYEVGIFYMLGASAFFMLFQITFANTLVYIKKHPKLGNEETLA